MYVKKKILVAGAAVPMMVTALVGLLTHFSICVKKEPPMKDPKKTVMTCTNVAHQLSGHDVHHEIGILRPNGSSKALQALVPLPCMGRFRKHQLPDGVFKRRQASASRDEVT